MAARTFARLASAGQGRRLFLLSWVAYAAAYVGRYNYSAVMSAITAEGTLTLSAAGAVSTGYFVCYAAGQILCGILSQKASPFGMIPLGLALSAGCNFGMGVAPAGAMPLLWAANGLFQAMVWPPIVRLFAECMPFEQQDSACVSINSTTPAGTLGAYALSAAALALAGWRMAFWACGVLMLAAAVLWTVGSAPLRRAAGSASAKAAPEGPAARKAEPGAARRMLPALFAAGLVWLVVPAMLHGGLKDGVTSWAPSMIQSNFGASPAFSAAVSMVLPLVNLTGAYLAGWLDHRVFRKDLGGFDGAGPGLPAGPAHGGAGQPAGLAGAAGRHHRPDAGGQHHVHQRDAGQDRPQHRRGGRGFRLGGGVRPLGRAGGDGAGRLPAAGPALGPLCPEM